MYTLEVIRAITNALCVVTNRLRSVDHKSIHLCLSKIRINYMTTLVLNVPLGTSVAQRQLIILQE